MKWFGKLMAKGGKLQFDELKQSVLDFENHGEAEDALELLKRFETQAHLLRSKIGEYPGNSVNAADWMDGVGMGHLAARLGDILKDRGDWYLEEVARNLAIKITCSVEGHYHHVVGPRMVSAIRCAERLEKRARVLELCDAVVEDFIWILEDEIDGEQPLTPEVATSIYSLMVALESEQALGAPARSFTVADARKVLERAPGQSSATE